MGPISILQHGVKYRATPLTEALQEVFDTDKCFFGGRQTGNAYVNKVAVTATTESWEEAV